MMTMMMMIIIIISSSSMSITNITIISIHILLQAHFAEISAEKEKLQHHVEQGAAEMAAVRSRLVGLEKMVQGYQDETAALQDIGADAHG